MGSINAQVYAGKISESVRKGKLIVKGKLIKESGYSAITSLNPARVENTKSFKKAMDIEKKPLLERIDKEIDAITYALSKKDKNKEEYRTLMGSLDILIKNKTILSGGHNTINVLVLPSEVLQRNSISTTQKIDDVQGVGGVPLKKIEGKKE